MYSPEQNDPGSGLSLQAVPLVTGVQSTQTTHIQTKEQTKTTKQLYTIAWERLCIMVVGCHVTGGCAWFVTEDDHNSHY